MMPPVRNDETHDHFQIPGGSFDPLVEHPVFMMKAPGDGEDLVSRLRKGVYSRHIWIARLQMGRTTIEVMAVHSLIRIFKA